MKVPKKVKDELQKVPGLLISLAKSALELSNDLVETAEAITKELNEMEVDEE